MTTTESTYSRARQPLSPERIAELHALREASPTGRVSIPADPRDIVFGRNIRTDAAATITKDYADRIRTEGCEQDPTVWINPDGFLQARDGQRRVLGAQAAELTELPVILREPPKGDSQTDQRISEINVQWKANEDRVNLTTTDKLSAAAEMLDLGVAVSKVAPKLSGLTTADVKAIKTIRTAKTDTPVSMAVGDQMSFTQAAALVEFEDDPDAVSRLAEAAHTGQFDYVATALRNKRASDAAYAAAAAEATAEGFTVLDTQPRWGDRDTYVSATRLQGPDGGVFDPATITEPKHWAVWLEETEKHFALDSGQEVDEDDIDWDTDNDPSVEPEDGLYAVAHVRTELVWQRHHYCVDIPATGLPDPRTTTRPAPDSPEALAEAAAEAKEKSKALTRTKAMNKAARAATPTRRAAVTKLLAGAKLPKGAHLWRTKLEASDPAIISEHNAAHLAAELLGINRDSLIDGSAFDNVSDNRAAVIGLGIAFAAVEARMHPNLGDKSNERPDWWRRSGSTLYRGIDTFKHYLAFLDTVEFPKGVEYVLSPVERYRLGVIDEDGFYAEENALTGTPA